MANQDISIKVSLDNSGFSKGIQGITKSLSRVYKDSEKLNTALSKIQGIPQDVVEGVMKMSKALKYSAEVAKDLARELKSVVAVYKQIKTNAVQVNKLTNRTATLLKKLGSAAAASSKRITTSLASIKNAHSAILGSTNKLVNIFKRLGAAARKYGKDSKKAHKENSDWAYRATGSNIALLRTIGKIRRAYYLINFGLAPLKKFVGTIGIAFTAVSYAIVRTTNNVDNLAKKSRLLNVPVKDMQALAFAADLAGVNFETLTMGMQRMTRRISQAAGVMRDSLVPLEELKLLKGIEEGNIRLAEQKLRDLEQRRNDIFSGENIQDIDLDILKAENKISQLEDSLNELGAPKAEIELEIGQAYRGLQKLRMQREKFVGGMDLIEINVDIKQATLDLNRMKNKMKETGEAAQAIKELGLDAKKLNQLASDKQFLKIAEALAKIKNKNDQIRIAQKIWDSEGVRNVLLLSSALKENIALFDKLGAGLSQQQATAVEAFKDSMTRLSTVIGGVLNKAVAYLSPLLEKAMDRFVQLGIDMGGVEKVALKIAKNIGLFLGYVVKGAGIAIEYIADMVSRTKILGLQIKKVFTTTLPSSMAGAFDKILGVIQAIMSNLKWLGSFLPVVGKSLEKFFTKQIEDVQKTRLGQRRDIYNYSEEKKKIEMQIKNVAPYKEALQTAEAAKQAGENIIKGVEERLGMWNSATQQQTTPTRQEKPRIGDRIFSTGEGKFGDFSGLDQKALENAIKQGNKGVLEIKLSQDGTIKSVNSTSELIKTIDITNNTARQVAK